MVEGYFYRLVYPSGATGVRVELFGNIESIFRLTGCCGINRDKLPNSLRRCGHKDNTFAEVAPWGGGFRCTCYLLRRTREAGYPAKAG